jgi:hypothetical protein
MNLGSTVEKVYLIRRRNMKAILEMEVPENCYVCPLFIDEYDVQCFFCGALIGACRDKRHPDCPLKIVEENKEEA